MKDLRRSKWVIIISIGLTIFTVLPVLAPIFAKLGLTPLADIIYWVYQWFCHQRPWRSYHLFDYQLAMDARMMLMFASMALSAYIIYFRKVKLLRPIKALALIIIFTLPLAMDGVVQAIAEITSIQNDSLPFYESTNLIRSLTGLIFGTGIGFAIFPYLNQYYGYAKFINNVKYIAGTIILSFLLIPLLAFLWSVTSSKYLPSALFFDNVSRYPGYNYEITIGAGHSTIKRIISEPVNWYLERAKKYDRQEILNEYYKNN